MTSLNVAFDTLIPRNHNPFNILNMQHDNNIINDQLNMDEFNYNQSSMTEEKLNLANNELTDDEIKALKIVDRYKGLLMLSVGKKKELCDMEEYLKSFEIISKEVNNHMNALSLSFVNDIGNNNNDKDKDENSEIAEQLKTYNLNMANYIESKNKLVAINIDKITKKIEEIRTELDKYEREIAVIRQVITTGIRDIIDPDKAHADKKLCPVCFENEVNMCYVPCGHTVCNKCCTSAKQMDRNKNKCGTCRSIISGTVKIYFSV